MYNHYTIWSKIVVNLKNFELDKLKPNNSINNHDTDFVESGKIILLKNNISHIVDKPFFDQSIDIRNKKLIFIIFIFVFSYFWL